LATLSNIWLSIFVNQHAGRGYHKPFFRKSSLKFWFYKALKAPSEIALTIAGHRFRQLFSRSFFVKEHYLNPAYSGEPSDVFWVTSVKTTVNFAKWSGPHTHNQVSIPGHTHQSQVKTLRTRVAFKNLS